METPKTSVTAILLAGGKGTRFNAIAPKQFLLLHGKPIVHYSYELFLSVPKIAEIIIVCSPEYETFFQSSPLKPISFARPGIERQDSVASGFKKISKACTHLLVHDMARPLLRKEDLYNLLEEGLPIGAATLGAPLKFTVKEVNEKQMVTQTLNRDCLYNIQTPQLLRRDILKKGLETAEKKGLTLTDDVSLAELIGHPVKIISSSEDNLKITLPLDLKIAEALIDETV